ncbi:MAG: hypothetical protein LUI39_02640 [Lachnospiraceae bacterium]|nr:hypothetical protein [Lachnospiraceae bacterium]
MANLVIAFFVSVGASVVGLSSSRRCLVAFCSPRGLRPASAGKFLTQPCASLSKWLDRDK